MPATLRDRAQPIEVAERIFALLDEAAFSSTYKYAVLMALLDLCFESTSSSGAPPTSLTTRQMARKVLELYWPQCVPYEDRRGYLRQGGVNERQQAELVARIIAFRETHPEQLSPQRARLGDERAFESLVDFVEWKLIEMPLPRLQVTGNGEDRFLYEYGWSTNIRQSTVRAYQRGDVGTFDNRLLLFDGVAEALIRLNTLLRPMIRREWLRQVQLFNQARLPASRLETFLFDREREALGALHGPLRHLQAGHCFYCEERLGTRAEVDHFIPWARYPNNAIENLVVAHDRCNNNKREYLAAAGHVDRWAHRLRSLADPLRGAAAEAAWESDPVRSTNVAVALYTQLPDSALVWEQIGAFARYELQRQRVEATLRPAA